MTEAKRIDAIIREENLDREGTYRLLRNAFCNCRKVAFVMEEVAKVLPPISRFFHRGERGRARERVVGKLSRFVGR